MARSQITQARDQDSSAPGQIAQPRQKVYYPYSDQSYRFNGTSSFMATTATLDLSAYNKVTLSAWVRQRTDQNSVIHELGTDYSAANNAFQCSYAQTVGQIQAGMYEGGNASLWRSEPIQLNQWIHVGIPYDRTLSGAEAAKVYLDGLLSGSNVDSSATFTGNFANATMYFGARAGTSAFATFDMVDLRIFSGAGDANDMMSIKTYGWAPGLTLLNNWLLQASIISNPQTINPHVGAATLTATSVTNAITGCPIRARTQS